MAYQGVGIQLTNRKFHLIFSNFRSSWFARMCKPKVIKSVASSTFLCWGLIWLWNILYIHDFVILQWDLVCDRAWLRAVSTSFFMLGNLLGAIVAGHVADRFSICIMQWLQVFLMEYTNNPGNILSYIVATYLHWGVEIQFNFELFSCVYLVNQNPSIE